MGLFDIFSSKPAEEAARARKAGLDEAYSKATASLTGGLDKANEYYGRALVPFEKLFSSGAAGVDAYSDALGLNGPEGSARAVARFETNPAYQVNMKYGLQAIDRGAAARGRLSSGNTVMAEQKFGSDLASQGWKDYLASFSPMLNLAGQGATGTATVNTTAAGTNYDAGKTGAGFAWNYGTGTGDANAAAALAPYNASANAWNALMGGLSMAGQVAGFKPAGTVAGKVLGWG